MSPTYTMSAHLCKQIYASWRQTHDHHPTTVTYNNNQVPDRSVADDKHYYHISTSAISSYMPYPQRSSSFSSSPKRSMDSDRSDEER